LGFFAFFLWDSFPLPRSLLVTFFGTRQTEGEDSVQKRIHSRDFKLDVVRQVNNGEKRPAQICREYGLAESVLSRWRKEYQESGEAAFQVKSSAEANTHEQKIAELERFCGQLALENQVLKKHYRVWDQRTSYDDRKSTGTLSRSFHRTLVSSFCGEPKLILRAKMTIRK
jgi:transposase-like protein